MLALRTGREVVAMFNPFAADDDGPSPQAIRRLQELQQQEPARTSSDES